MIETVAVVLDVVDTVVLAVAVVALVFAIARGRA